MYVHMHIYTYAYTLTIIKRAQSGVEINSIIGVAEYRTLNSKILYARSHIYIHKYIYTYAPAHFMLI